MYKSKFYIMLALIMAALSACDGAGETTADEAPDADVSSSAQTVEETSTDTADTDTDTATDTDTDTDAIAGSSIESEVAAETGTDSSLTLSTDSSSATDTETDTASAADTASVTGTTPSIAKILKREHFIGGTDLKTGDMTSTHTGTFTRTRTGTHTGTFTRTAKSSATKSGSGSGTGTSTYKLDRATMYFRGFNLDYQGDQAEGIMNVTAGLNKTSQLSVGTSISQNKIHDTLAGTTIDSISYYTGAGMYAWSDGLLIDWYIHAVGVQYDSGTMKRYSDRLWCSTVYATDCPVYESIDVATAFGSEFNPNDYFYVVSIDDFYATDLYCKKSNGETRDYDAEDFVISTYIKNDILKTNSLDFDNDNKNGSNGNDHYIGTDGKLTVYIDYNISCPNGETIPPPSVSIDYSITAYRQDVWGFKWFGWNDTTATTNDAGKCESATTLEGLAGILGKSHAFVTPHSMGFNGDYSTNHYIDNFYNNVTLDSVDAANATATVRTRGCIEGQDSAKNSPFQLYANETMGYLLYCKDANACNTQESYNQGTDNAGGYSVIESSLTITF